MEGGECLGDTRIGIGKDDEVRSAGVSGMNKSAGV